MPHRVFYFFLLFLDLHLFLFLTEFKIKFFFRTDKTLKCSLMLLGKSLFWMQKLLQFMLSIADHTGKSNKLLLKQRAFLLLFQSVNWQQLQLRNPLNCTSEITITIATNWHFCWQPQEKKAANDWTGHACQKSFHQNRVKAHSCSSVFVLKKFTYIYAHNAQYRCSTWFVAREHYPWN